MQLNLERLDERVTPANLIPGYTGPEQVIQGHFDGDTLEDTAVVAETGGSCRVMVVSAKGDVLLNTIVFDPSFRGGGQLAAIGSIAGGDAQDSLLVAPGPGGGSVVAQFNYDLSTGAMVQTASFYAPYDQDFRDGLQVSEGEIPVNGVLTPIALFLPGDQVEDPTEVGVDLQTHETLFTISVANPEANGLASFEPTGGTIDASGGQVGLVVQYGPIVNDYVPTKVWSLEGDDITDQFTS